MSFGLTFIGVAVSKATKQHWINEAHAHNERMDRHARLAWIDQESLSHDERAILDGIAKQLQADEPVQSQRNCPDCRRPFQIVRVGEIEVDSCRFCRGIWFDPGELKNLAGISTEQPDADKATRASRHSCPDCQTAMIEFALFHPLNLLVDRCPQGHGVYLEDRELERVFKIS